MYLESASGSSSSPSPLTTITDEEEEDEEEEARGGVCDRFSRFIRDFRVGVASDGVPVDFRFSLLGSEGVIVSGEKLMGRWYHTRKASSLDHVRWRLQVYITASPQFLCCLNSTLHVDPV